VTRGTTAFDFASPRASCYAWNETVRETDREYLSVKLDDLASMAKSDGDSLCSHLSVHDNTKVEPFLAADRS
jgi:hypothetical protein